MPSFHLPKIPLYDPMVDTVDSAIQRLSLLTNKNFDIVRRLMYGQLDSVNIRSGGILLSDLTGGLLPQNPESLGPGLNLTADYMGYFDGEEWQAFIDGEGRFFFGGDDENYLQWDGETMFVRGYLDAVIGTFEVIGAGSFPDGSKILLGKVDDEPLIEMYDADDTLRVRLEKDRLAFYTEFIPEEGEDPEMDSVYAGMVKGLYWRPEPDQIIPEVRIETPQYSHLITTNPSYLGKYGRIATIASDYEVFVRMVASNRWDTEGDVNLPNLFSLLQLDEDATLESLYGDINLTCGGSVFVPQALVLNSENADDHLIISRYYEDEEETFTMKVTHEVLNKAAVFVLEDDAEKFNFYIGTTPLMQIDSKGGGADESKPCVRMWSDLEVEGDIFYGGWA